MYWMVSFLLNFVFPLLVLLLIFIFMVILQKWLDKDGHIPIRDATHHNWCSTKLLMKPSRCCVCEALLMDGSGYFCDCCGVFADRGCVRTADRKLRCKVITAPDKSSIKHHWVKGNLPLGAVCEVCEEDCGSDDVLSDQQCCWCQKTVHAACQPKFAEVCDFGRFRKFIIPPNCVVLTKKRPSVLGKLQLRSVTPPNWEDWSPLIVLANRKSGSNDAERVLCLFRRFLNPAQVVDLADRPPEVVLEWCSLLGKVKCTVLVAGGDGTVAWVLNAIHRLNLNPIPATAVIPLGTGNDLSRVLGWGRETAPDFDPGAVLEHIGSAKTVHLDRWSVEVRPLRHITFRHSRRNVFMYNYISFGVDAQVTLDFHRTRDSLFYLFSSRVFNKMLYLCYGTQQAVERGCRGLEKKIEVYLDGELVELPAVESVVVLNIPSWGAGVRLWDLASEEQILPFQEIDDGILEVVALYSSFHIAQLQIGLSQPHVVGQARNVQIKLKGKVPVQVDGEPWIQSPANITINHQNQAVMLQREETE